MKIKHSGSVPVIVYNIIIFLVLALYCASLLFLIVWMLYASFKSAVDYALNTFGLPNEWVIENYTEVFRLLKVKVSTSRGIVEYNMLDMAVFSVVRSAGTSLIMVFTQTCVAYILSKYKFFGNKFIYTLGIVVMIIPIVGNLPSAMLVRKSLGIYDNLALHILTSPSVIFGLHFLILYGAFKSISWSYAEAAFIDGAGHYSVMFRIILPMMIPTCVALFVLDFLSSWNDYMTHLVWLPSYPNLAYGMYRFQYDATGGNSSVTTPMILAGFTIVMIPTVALYGGLQGIIMRQLNVGGLKG